MASNLADLIASLSEKECAMDELADILTEEQRCIVSLDTVSLARNDLRKGDLLSRLANLQQICSCLLRRALEERGLPDDQRLTSLVGAAASSDRDLLAPLQERLASRARDLDRQLRTNRCMLENSLGLVRNTMALFGKLLGDCTTYCAQGTIRSGSSGGLLLRREI